MIPRLTLVVALVSGFISLSYEILWFRAASCASQSAYWVFGALLGAYLGGLALGSLVSGKFCETNESTGHTKQLSRMGWFALVANVAAWLVIPVGARCSHWIGIYVCIVFASALLGALFPILCHYAIPADHQAGRGVSYLYIANIIGSSAGSLLTGFLLMDHWGLAAICLGVAFGGLGLAGCLLLVSDESAAGRRRSLALLAGSVLTVFALHDQAYNRVYERLMAASAGSTYETFTDLVETKSGVIAVDKRKNVFGGGAYDGAISVDMVTDINGLYRAYAIPAMHPAPKRVLMVGLATGAWAEVVLHLPGVEKVTAIEINPGYLQIIRRYPEVAPILTDPRLTIDIDDGRRWMRRHPLEKFDIVVMNTTWHWRGHATSLLSREFQESVRQHLAPGGIFYFNTTFSEDVQRTAVETYPYGLRIFNFMAVSDAPLDFDTARWAAALEFPRRDGRPTLDTSTAEGRKAFDALMDLPKTRNGPPHLFGLETAESLRERLRNAVIVTEDNMWCEFHPTPRRNF